MEASGALPQEVAPLHWLGAAALQWAAVTSALEVELNRVHCYYHPAGPERVTTPSALLLSGEEANPVVPAQQNNLFKVKYEKNQSKSAIFSL